MDHSERSNRMRFDSTSPRPPTYCTAAPLRLRARAASAQRETSESWIYLCFNLNLVTEQLMWQQWGSGWRLQVWCPISVIAQIVCHVFIGVGRRSYLKGNTDVNRKASRSPSHTDIKHSLTCEHEYNIINSTLQHIGASHSVNVDVFYSLSVLLTSHFSQYLQLFVCVRLATILSTHFLHSAS